MSNTVTIGDRRIGDGEPAYIIAEIGINHNGSIDQAKRLIQVAVSAGTGDPFQLVACGVEIVKVFGFVVGLLSAGEGKHVLRGGNNRVWPWRGKFHPIRKVEALGCETREGLLGILRTLGWK